MPVCLLFFYYMLKLYTFLIANLVLQNILPLLGGWLFYEFRLICSVHLLFVYTSVFSPIEYIQKGSMKSNR